MLWKVKVWQSEESAKWCKKRHDRIESSRDGREEKWWEWEEKW